MASRVSANLFRTRRGALIISLFAGVLAAILLVVYLESYRSSVNSGNRPEQVLVARRLISQGTSATSIAQQRLYEVTTVQKSQLDPLAITDPTALGGRIAATDIYPGQQLTQQDFTTENAGSLSYQLSGSERAIAIPIDTLHGMLGVVTPGTFVDVYVEIAGPSTSTTASAPTRNVAGASTTQVRLLAADVEVLGTPQSGSPAMILRVSDADAASFAYAADYERFWLVIRPQTGATRTPPSVATLGALLSGAG